MCAGELCIECKLRNMLLMQSLLCVLQDCVWVFNGTDYCELRPFERLVASELPGSEGQRIAQIL